ncbi:MAG TPA: endo-1,4-beta-xylanase [bacterium]|nr:endo-1,4-beta-xylanase [bacterium]
MKSKLLPFLVPFLFLVLAVPLRSQEVPSGGESLFAKPALEAIQLNGEKGKLERVAVTGQAFHEALQLTTLEATQDPWGVQVDAPVDFPVHQGDVVLAQFWMKSDASHVESGEAQSEFVFERLGDPWTKSVSFNLSVGPQWRLFNIPFTVVEDLEKGKSHICFRMGYRPQSFELAGFKLLNYGKKVALSALPQTQLVYGGMEADAPWRKAAQERIERIRKGDLRVVVKDAKGRPVPGAQVRVEMERNDFGFGTAVVAQKLALATPENDRYQKEVERLFNRVVFENDLKWGPWEDGASNSGYWRRDYVKGAMAWLSKRDFDVRGHNMVWGTWRYLPPEVKALSSDKKALEAKIEERIADVGGAMKGQLVEWDVVNEPVPEHELTDILGRSAMVTWYQAARRADPKAVLFVNDYPGPDTIGHLESYDQTIAFLLQEGAPLGGVGLQGHVGSSPWSIPALLSTLDKLGAHGLPVEITEYDTDIADEELDARFLGDFLTAVFSHPSVNAFLMWGFWDGAHWHHKAPLFKEDWTEKPAGKVYEDLVLHRWWTREAGKTDGQGDYQVRGFLGDYKIVVLDGRTEVTQRVHLVKQGARVEFTLKRP